MSIEKGMSNENPSKVTALPQQEKAELAVAIKRLEKEIRDLTDAMAEEFPAAEKRRGALLEAHELLKQAWQHATSYESLVDRQKQDVDYKARNWRAGLMPGNNAFMRIFDDILHAFPTSMTQGAPRWKPTSYEDLKDAKAEWNELKQLSKEKQRELQDAQIEVIDREYKWRKEVVGLDVADQEKYSENLGQLASKQRDLSTKKATK